MSGGSGGTKAVLDTSPEAGLCGQYVYELDDYCPNPPALNPQPFCSLSNAPDCATLEGWSNRASSRTTACGYLFIFQELGEGDSQAIVYDLATQRLVYYTTFGPIAAGCGVKGTRVGAPPPTCNEAPVTECMTTRS